jgi:anion-transporting  ArsA/GET3 family ATPase
VLFFTDDCCCMNPNSMKTYLPYLLALGLFFSSAGLKAQNTSNNRTVALTPVEKIAKKRTQLLKDQLFLSNDQTSEILKINIEMLNKLDALNAKKLDKAAYNREYTQLENNVKTKIVVLLTPAQRQRFETKLFSEVYQTHIDKKKAVSVNRKK